jgi:hypothetical protein
MQVKSSRRDTTTTTTFKGETGCMNPIISCKDHDRSKRDVYDICETNEGGEVRCFTLSQISGIHQPFFLQTALQVYCQAYKQAAVGQAHGLLRKARRLDTILNIRSETIHPPSNAPDPECRTCRSQFSPSFYRVPTLSVNGHRDGQDIWICHRCYFEANEANLKPMGMNVS